MASAPENDKFQYTHFAHKINSFDTAPKKLLASDSRLRPDRYALEKGDLSKAGSEKSRFVPRPFQSFLYAAVSSNSQLRFYTFFLWSVWKRGKELKRELERRKDRVLCPDGLI